MKKFTKVILSVLFTCVLAFALLFFFAPETFEKISAPTLTFEAGNYTDYYYVRLNDNEKLAYTALKQKLPKFSEKIPIPEISSNEFNNVLNVLSYDDPYLFMSDGGTILTVGKLKYYEPAYKLTKQEYDSSLEQINLIADEILKKLPRDEYEAQLYLHDYIINNCTYSDTDSNEESNIIGVFLNKKAKCSGYASAFKLLLDKAGIESVLITGKAADSDGNIQSHMWNAVKIKDSWVYTDTTWDDPVSDDGKEYCRRIYFSMSEDMLRRTHGEFEFDFEAKDASLYYYNVINAYYNNYNSDTKNAVARLIAAAAAAGEDSVQFMFVSKSAYNTAVDRLFEGEEIYGILESADRNSAKHIETNSVRYSPEEEHNLITLIFQTKD